MPLCSCASNVINREFIDESLPADRCAKVISFSLRVILDPNSVPQRNGIR